MASTPLMTAMRARCGATSASNAGHGFRRFTEQTVVASSDDGLRAVPEVSHWLPTWACPFPCNQTCDSCLDVFDEGVRVHFNDEGAALCGG